MNWLKFNRDELLATCGVPLGYALGYMMAVMHYDPISQDWQWYVIAACSVVWMYAFLNWIYSGISLVKSKNDLLKLCQDMDDHIKLDHELIDAMEDYIANQDKYPPEEVIKLREGMKKLLEKRTVAQLVRANDS